MVIALFVKILLKFITTTGSNMSVNTYKFNTCAYWCCDVIKKSAPDFTIKALSVKVKLQLVGKFYKMSTINNALLQLARDGHLNRESTNMCGETIYTKKEVK